MLAAYRCIVSCGRVEYVLVGPELEGCDKMLSSYESEVGLERLALLGTLLLEGGRDVLLVQGLSLGLQGVSLCLVQSRADIASSRWRGVFRCRWPGYGIVERCEVVERCEQRC